MVTRERAQLLLIGSLLIALVVIGLTVLVNSVLFTESVGSGTLDNRIQEAQEFDTETIESTRSLVFRVSHRTRNVTEAELRGNVARNITLLSRAMGESYANTRPVAVTVSFSNVSKIGNRTVQAHDANITDNTGSKNWSPYSTEKTVGWFSMNIDVKDTDTDPFFINATNATSGRWVNITLRRQNNGNVSVVSNVSDTPNTVRSCEPSRGRVLLDVYEGQALTSPANECTFNGTDTLTAPYDIKFENGKNLTGKYSIVTKEPVSGLPTCDGKPPEDAEPCVAPVIWTANVSTAFEGEGISYSNNYNVSIYGENA